MKLKNLRDIANALPAMFGSEKMTEDLELLSDLPDGTLRVDFLGRTAEHSRCGSIQLPLIEDLSAWMRGRLEEYGIPLNELNAAVLEVEIRTDGLPTNKKSIVSFDFHMKSLIVAGDRKYEHVASKHKWYRRGGRL